MNAQPHHFIVSCLREEKRERRGRPAQHSTICTEGLNHSKRGANPHVLNTRWQIKVKPDRSAWRAHRSRLRVTGRRET